MVFLIRRLRSTLGFTLIELLVVILIIAILVAVAAPSFLGQTQKAHDSAAQQYLAVAYKEATAWAVDHTGAGSPWDGNCATTPQGDFAGGACTADSVAHAIAASEPGLTVVSGSCPTDATTDQKHIVVDSSYTTGNNLKLCNDPTFNNDRRVWILTVTGGALQPFPEQPTLVSGNGPGGTVDSGSGGGGSSGSGTSNGDTGSVVDPSSGTVTVTPVGGGETGWTISDPTPPSPANPVVITITITGGDATTLTVEKNGAIIPPCSSAGTASPDPCVSSRINAGGSGTIVIDSGGDSSAVYTVTDCTPGAIVFLSSRSGQRNLYSMNSDGSNQHPLIGSGCAVPAGSGNYPSLFLARAAASGDVLLDYASGHTGELDVINSSGLHQIVPSYTSDANGTEAAISPDGTLVASAENPFTSIQITNVADLQQHTVVIPGGLILGWAPVFLNNTTLVFVGFDPLANQEDIYSINVDGSGLTQLTNTLIYKYDVAVSADGSKITYDDRDPGTSQMQVYVLNANGSHLVDISNDPSQNDSQPQLSPDGSKVAFISTRGGDSSLPLYWANSDGSGIQRLSSEMTTDALGIASVLAPFSWSADGSSIVFSSDRTSDDIHYGEIFKVTTPGAVETQLTSGSTNNDIWPFGH